jgi:protein gp37
MALRLAAMGFKDYQKVITNGYWNGKTALVESALEKPLHWKKPRKIFVDSMGDLFHPSVSFEWIDTVMATNALCPQHTFQILTKRPERMMEYFSDNPYPFQNLHLGVTCCTQSEADKNIPILLNIPATMKFVCIEPCLEEIDIHIYLVTDRHETFKPVDWVIVGCESGQGSRPCQLNWIRSIVNQCKATNVPVFVKQIPLYRIANSKDIHVEGKDDNRFAQIICHDVRKFPADLQFQECPK